MKLLAQKLKSLDMVATRTAQLGALFGQSSSDYTVIDQTPIRIGMWPCLSSTHPQIAMGLWSLLAHLLDRWTDVKTYRLFLKVSEGYVPAGTPSPDDIQFSVDDWTLENLGENAAIWGNLEQIADGWQLTIHVEADDSLESTAKSSEHTLQIIGSTLHQIIRQLPDLTAHIASTLNATRLDDSFLHFDTRYEPDNSVEFMIKLALHWELKLLGMLAGAIWADEAFVADLHHMTNAAEMQSALGKWITGRILGRVLLPGFSLVGQLVTERWAEIADAADYAPEVVVPLANGIYKLGLASQAFELLEDSIEDNTIRVEQILKLTELYLKSGRIGDAIDIMQDSLTTQEPEAALLRLYGNAVLAASQSGYIVKNFVLCSDDETKDFYHEVIEAYRRILNLRPDDLESRYKLLVLHEFLEEDLFLETLRNILQQDTTHRYTQDVLSLVVEVEGGMSAILEEFERALSNRPDDAELKLGYAMLLIEHQEEDQAITILEDLLDKLDDNNLLAEAERLLWIAEDPEFERRFGEISALVDAGNAPPNALVDYLEELLNNAPHYQAGYLLLARAYQLRNDLEAALEVLLDGHKNLGNDPDLLEALGTVLWEQGEDTLAIEYLNKGLEVDPTHIRLLVRIGRCLFEHGQSDDARIYLLRAEALNSRDPFLNETRAYIARNIINRKVK